MWQEAWDRLQKDADGAGVQEGENGASGEDVQFVAIAMDAQGWKVARPYVDKAGLTFPAAVDREGVLWEALDFNFVPLQILFDEEGREVLRTRGAPDEDLLARLDEAFETPPPPGVRTASGRMGPPVDPDQAAAARKLFARGVDKLEAGEEDQAADLWRRALAKDPNNWLIRKQIWALENPDRFYAGEIDGEWQRELLREMRDGSPQG